MIVAPAAGLPLPMRCAYVGMVIVGAGGAIAGLVIGLHVRAATAWFAVFEVGVPAAIVGAVIGFIVGSILAGWRGIRTGGPPDTE